MELITNWSGGEIPLESKCFNLSRSNTECLKCRLSKGKGAIEDEVTTRVWLCQGLNSSDVLIIQEK